METQDLIEVRKDSTYTFTHFIESQNNLIVPSTATIVITDSAGTSLLSSTAMTISAAGVCTYAWDSSGVDVGMNYLVTYQLDSYEPVIRLFDIMCYPFVNNVTDSDLFAEYRGLKSNSYENSGIAQSGSTTTLVDVNRAEKDNHWKGGQIEIYQGQSVLVLDIVSSVQSTNTITFTPTLSTAVTTENYTIRQSYQEDINTAGKKVQLYFKSLEKRAYLVIDSYTLKQLIIYEVMKQYFFENIKANDDEQSIKYNHYATMYKSTLESLKLVYDNDSDGVIDDGEEDDTTGKIVMFR